MPRLIAPALLALFAATALPAATRPLSAKDEATLGKLLAGRTAGPPMSCIPRQANQHIQQIGEQTLIYSNTNRTLYRNDPPGGCLNGGRGYAILTTSPIGQVCSGDIIRVFDQYNRIEIGSCTLGDFVPYAKAR